jgi:transcriptional regulator with XRE-family HTH domain
MSRRESLQQVADAVGVSKAHIWELEKGRTDNPSMALVTRLADHFNVSVSYLVSEDVDAPDADVELARMFRQAQGLDDRERRIKSRKDAHNSGSVCDKAGEILQFSLHFPC